MRLSIVPLLTVLTACGAAPYTKTTGGDPVPAEKGKTYSYDFDAYAAGEMPNDFEEVLVEWEIASADQRKLVRQTGSFGDPDFPRVVVRKLTFTNVHVKTRCKPESGSTDRACGLMFRFQNSDDYYITRANALENNVRIYYVKGGVRTMFANSDLRVPTGAGRRPE